MPKVLRIINRFNLGGITYNVAYLSRYLHSDFETMVIGGVPQPDEAHSGFILDNLGVPYREIPTMRRSINPLNDWKTYREIRRIIRQFKPDIVHTHAAKAGLVGRLAARHEGVPVIVHTFHGHVFSHYFSPWKTALVKMVERYLASISSTIIAISKIQKDQLRRIHEIAPEKKVRVIQLGFDLKKFATGEKERRELFRTNYQLKETDVAVGIIGRFAPVKNHKMFFDVLQELQRRNVRVKAFVIGDGELKTQLMQWALPLSSTETIEPGFDVYFTSWIKNMDEVLPGLDIVVLTSLNEGTPVSLIEAQAAGRPVISTNVGGVADVVLNNETGFIVSDFSVDVYAQKMCELISDPALRSRFGKAGNEYALANFHYERLVVDTENLYRELLSKNSSPL